MSMDGGSIGIGRKQQSVYNDLFSERCKTMKASEVRELLKLTQQPDIISFAGGLPNPLAFPKEEIAEVVEYVIKEKWSQALQYSTTEGLIDLRENIVKWMSRRGANDSIENIMIVSGSQQGLDLIGKVFLDPGDVIITAEPTYLAAITAFKAYQAKIETVPLDEEGIDTETLRKKLHHLHRHGQNPKFIYLVPNFQNPAGVTLTLERRKEILEMAETYDLLILEDDPYGELRYEGEHIKHCRSLDTEERVIYFGTFSKILAPGYRIGWVSAPEEIIKKMVIAKQFTDLCTNPFGQHVVAEFMSRGLVEKHIENIKALYGRKQKIMLKALDEHFTMDEVHWTKPEGGMFLWVTMPEYMSSRRMFKYAIKEKVAYVTGGAFFPNGGGDNCMRLNFTHATDENIDIGIEKLAGVIEKELVRQKEEPVIDLETPITL